MTQSAKPVKKYFADIRLTKLVAQQGGKRRDEAVAGAQARVEALRGDSIEGIESALREAEAMLLAAADGNLNPQELGHIQELADRIVTLSGTFGYAQLDNVARSLGDLTNILLASGSGPIGPLLVHVHAAWLFAPRAAPLADEDSSRVLSELSKVLEHFGLLSVSEPAPDTILDQSRG